uniref:Cell division protein FtsL n=1 Tax=Desulfacinum infernum TaxID=35837 RepID=A0A832EC65_9BACT
MMRLLAILLGIFGVGLAGLYMWLQSRQVSDSYRIMQLQQEYATWFEVKRRVELEWGRLQAPDRLQAVARGRFQLREARESERWFLEEP